MIPDSVFVVDGTVKRQWMRESSFCTTLFLHPGLLLRLIRDDVYLYFIRYNSSCEVSLTGPAGYSVPGFRFFCFLAWPGCGFAAEVISINSMSIGRSTTGVFGRWKGRFTSTCGLGVSHRRGLGVGRLASLKYGHIPFSQRMGPFGY